MKLRSMMLALVCSIVGCSESEAASPAALDAGPTAPSIVGRWVSATCEALPQPDGSTMYFQRDFDIADSDWAIDGTLFADAACTTKVFTLSIEGGYRILRPSAVVDGAWDAEFDRDRIGLTVFYDGFRTMLGGACGELELGVEKDVTASGCAFIPSSSACEAEHDLISLRGDDLYFGQRPADGDMCSAPKRPRALTTASVRRSR